MVVFDQRKRTLCLRHNLWLVSFGLPSVGRAFLDGNDPSAAYDREVSHRFILASGRATEATNKIGRDFVAEGYFGRAQYSVSINRSVDDFFMLGPRK